MIFLIVWLFFYEKGKNRNSIFVEREISGTTSVESQNIEQEWQVYRRRSKLSVRES